MPNIKPGSTPPDARDSEKEEAARWLIEELDKARNSGPGKTLEEVEKELGIVYE